MLAYVARRLVQMVPILLAVALLIFVIFSLIPGTFATGMMDQGRGLSAQAIAQLNHQLGLDQPLPMRFARYVLHLAQLDLGTSFRTQLPVMQALRARAWPTVELIVTAMIFASVIGVPLGFLSALRPGSLWDGVSILLSVSVLSLPAFWFGLLLMYCFALLLGWLPSFGYGNGGLRHLALPAVALGVGTLGMLARTTRAAVLDVMGADFIRTARSKGMSESRIVRWHLVRNVLVVILTVAGLEFGSMIGQAIVVEQLFAWPGLGSLLVESVEMRDVPVVQGCILMIVLAFLLINLVVDTVDAMVDPRIEYN